jgi:iron(III) transport system substrate-binding protein
LAQAYQDYAGTPLEVPDGKNAAEVFMQRLVQNVQFSNSSDEVVEAIGSASGTGHFGFMISSKQRLQAVGYHVEPIYKLNPFSGSYASTSVMIAGGAKNVNSAKLFIRWLLGETDGTGEGYKPYQTAGTWSPRTDIPDGNDVPQSEIDLLWLDKDSMKENRAYIMGFCESMLKAYGEQEKEH